MGTPSYMAPEQAAGRTGQVGPAADVYALGAILYECLTGPAAVPRRPTPVDTLLQVVQRRAGAAAAAAAGGAARPGDDLPEVPGRRSRGSRYATARTLADDLRRFLAGEPIQARPVGHRQRLGAGAANPAGGGPGACSAVLPWWRSSR